MNKRLLLMFAAACVFLQHGVFVSAGSRMIGGSPAGWQVFVIPTEQGPEFALARSGQRLKYAIDIDSADVRITSLALLEVRLRQLKRLQWVAVDQWERGTEASELEFIKQRIAALCLEQKLGCYYSF